MASVVLEQSHMLRERWAFVGRVHEEIPPQERAVKDNGERISQEILKSFRGEKTTEVKHSIMLCGSLFVDIAKNGKHVITPYDIQAAVELGSSAAREVVDARYPPIVETWLPNAGLTKVEAEYCESTKWEAFEFIYVAPVAPSLNDMLDCLGNPPVISSITINQLLIRAFTEFPRRSDDDYADRVPEVDASDLDAFYAKIKSELDDHNWVGVPTTDTDIQIWLNPSAIDEDLRDRSPKLPSQKVDEVIVNSILHNIPEINPDVDVLIDDAITRTKAKLENTCNWNYMIVNGTEWWYPSVTTFEGEFAMYADKSEDILKNHQDASIDELRMAKDFFNRNKQNLVRVFDADSDHIEKAVRQLKAQIRFNKEDAMLASASHGEGELESAVETETPTEYHVAKELEEELQDDDEDDDPDKGISSYRY